MASSSSSDVAQAAQEETPATSTEGGSSSSVAAPARGFASAWASRFSQKASELKAATKDAMQQTKDAFAAEAKLVAKDMADLKDGVAEGVRLTVQDTSQLRERIGQQTRKVFASKDAGPQNPGARAESAEPGEGEDAVETGAGEQKKGPPGLFGPDTAEHLKGKVQDLKAGGKKAAEKVRDVGGKLWHKTDHWFHQLRGDAVKEGAVTQSWEECHQYAAQLYESQAGEADLAWALEELKMGTLQAYAKSAVIFHQPEDKAAVAEFLKSPGHGQCAAHSMTAYCHTPLRTAEKRCDVHIFSLSPSFLEISSPMDQAQRKALREKLRWLCYTVSCCASQHQLSIAWHLPGGEPDVTFLESESAPVTLEGLQELCKVMMKDQLKTFPEVDLVTAKLPEIPGYFDTPGSEDDGSSLLFVTLGEPWQGPLLAGGFTSCSALSLLCRPTTNPYLNQVSLAPPEALKAAPPPPLPPPTTSAADFAAAAMRSLEAEDEDSPSGPEAIIGEDDDLLDLEDDAPASNGPVVAAVAVAPESTADASSVANGAGAGYPATDDFQANQPGHVEEEIDWLDELAAEQPAEGPAASTTVPTVPAAPAATSGDKGIVDADFDALWDSMMDDDKAPAKDVANGS